MSPNLKKMGLGSSQPVELFSMQVKVLLNHRDGVFQLDPALNRFYSGTMKDQFKDADVAVVSVIGPPTSGKSQLLHKAMTSLVKQKNVAREVNLDTSAPGGLTNPNRVLLLAPPVELNQKKRKKIIVFGLDIDSREYAAEVYEKLVDFVVSISSLTIAVIPCHYEPAVWDCKKNFTKVDPPRQRFQQVGIAILAEGSSIPAGEMDVEEVLQLQNFDEKKIEAVKALKDAFCRTKVFFLPTLNSETRLPNSPSHYDKFFESLFEELQPVERNKMSWDFRTFQENIKVISQGMNQSNPFAPQEAQPSYSPGEAARYLFPGHSSQVYNFLWFNKTYDEMFGSMGRQGQLPYLEVDKINQIHQVIAAELHQIREHNYEVVTSPALNDLLRNRKEFHVQKQTEERNQFQKFHNAFNYLFLQEKYNLALLVLQPASLHKSTYSDQNLCSHCDKLISSLPENHKQYFAELYAEFRSDLQLAVHMINYYRKQMDFVLEQSTCVTDEYLKTESERIQGLVWSQGNFLGYKKAVVRLQDLVIKAVDLNYTWISEVNKNRCSLEKRVIAIAIDRVVTNYRLFLTKYASEQILPEFQLSHLHEQLFEAAKRAFLLKNSAKVLHIPFLWESSLPKLTDAIKIEFRKIYLENSKKLHDYIKPRKMLLRMCLNKYQEIIAQSPSSTEEISEMARQAAMEFFRQESAQLKIEDVETLEKELQVAIGRNVAPESRLVSVSKPISSEAVAEVKEVQDICIHIVTSEIIVTWPDCPEGVIKFLPLMTISQGFADFGEAAKETYEKDQSRTCILFDIFELISSGLPPSQKPIPMSLGNMPIECAEDVIAIFFNLIISSVPKLANWKRSCVVILSAGTLPDARIRLQAATLLANIQILRIFNPSTALCLSYFYNCLEKPKLPSDHEVLLISSGGQERVPEVQIGSLSESAIKTRDAKIINSKLSNILELHKLLSETQGYTPEDLQHELNESDYSTASCTDLLLQNQNIQLMPTRADEGLYAGVFAWMSSKGEIEISQSVAVEATFSIPCGSSSIKLTAGSGLTSIWRELILNEEDSTVFMYQRVLKLLDDAPMNMSRPFKLAIPTTESCPEDGRKFYASMDLNGIINLEVKIGEDVFKCRLDGMIADNQLHTRWFNGPKSRDFTDNPSVPPSPALPSIDAQVCVERVKTTVAAESPLPPQPTPSCITKSTMETTSNPQEKLQVLIQQMEDRISEGTVRGPTKKLLEKRIQEAKLRLFAADATSKLYEAAFRSLQATAQALDQEDDQD